MSVHELEVALVQCQGRVASLERDYERVYDELVRVRAELWALTGEGRIQGKP